MSPPDLICRGLENFHVLTDLPYWQSIILGTIIMRIALLPSTIMGLRMTSRITFVRAEFDKINKLAEAQPHKKPIYDQEIQYLYKKHKVNPIGGFINPLIQFPIFISTFFALRKMGTFFPEMSTGGAFWFTDLAVADATYILPVLNVITLTAVTEIGTRNVDTSRLPWFKPVMRGLSVVAFPLTMYFPSVSNFSINYLLFIYCYFIIYYLLLLF